jgi:5'-nucleotidase
MPPNKSTLVKKFDKDKHSRQRLYWLAGEFVNQDKGQDTDGHWQMAISVVPVQFDLTAHHATTA